MGMFDDVICKYPLPWSQFQDAVWQSKDTPAQYLDAYEIREDGTLWHEAYDTRFENNPKSILGFHIHRENIRWEQVFYEGELEIHASGVKPFEPRDNVNVRFWFVDGIVKDLICKNKNVTEKEGT